MRTDNDVSLFFYSGHGCEAYNTAFHGALCGTGDTFLPIGRFAPRWIKFRKKIVIINACHSGAAIDKESSLTDDALKKEMRSFNSAVISEFSAADKAAEARGAHDLSKPSYYVLTSSSSAQNSYEFGSSNRPFVGALPYALLYGCGWDMRYDKPISELYADKNGDRRISLREAYSWAVYAVAEYTPVTQDTQVYPVNSSFILWGK